MHAHNIDVERFNKATKLFTTINGELDSAIGKLIGTHEDNESTSMVAKDFNKILGVALQNMQSSIKLSGIAEAFDAMYSPQMKEKWEILSKAMSEQVTKNLTVSLGQYTLKPEVTEALSNMGKLAALQVDVKPMQQALGTLVEQMKQYEINIPADITDFQEKLLDINVSALTDGQK